jgi:hypothetical protein
VSGRNPAFAQVAARHRASRDKQMTQFGLGGIPYPARLGHIGSGRADQAIPGGGCGASLPTTPNLEERRRRTDSREGRSRSSRSPPG